jgi:hypothetical protein
MTIAQQLKIKNFPFFIEDENDKRIYWEDSDGYWCKYEYDLHDNLIGFEDSTGYWGKSEFDVDGNKIYFENSDGVIRDKRQKWPFSKAIVEVTLEEIAKKMGINVTQLRIKD